MKERHHSIPLLGMKAQCDHCLHKYLLNLLKCPKCKHNNEDRESVFFNLRGPKRMARNIKLQKELETAL